MSRLDVLLRYVRELEDARTDVQRQMEQAARYRRWAEWDALRSRWDALNAGLGSAIQEMADLAEGLSWPQRARDRAS